QGGIHEIWHPGEISDFNLKEYQYLRVKNDQLWWISSSKKFRTGRAGCILVDGIFTEDNAQSCFVINLTREHYPKLTVDRKKIVDWDEKWVYQALISSIKELVSWSETSFPWLWSLSRQWPKVAGQLCQVLENQNRSIRFSRWFSDASKLPVGQVGCFAGDLGLLSHGIDEAYQPLSRILGTGMPSWLFPYRALIWGEYEKIALPEVWLDSLPEWLKLCSLPKITAEDGFVLRMDLNRNATSRYHQDKVPSAHIALSAYHLHEPIAITYRRFLKFASLGLSIPKVNIKALEDITIDELDHVLITSDVEGSKHIDSRLSKNLISASHLVLSAEKLSESIQSIHKRFSKFKPLGLRLPRISNSDIAEIRASSEDLSLISELNKSEADNNFVYPANILFLSREIGESVDQISTRLSRFSALGLTLPKIEPNEFKGFSIDDEDFRVLSPDLDGTKPLLSNRISILHLLKISAYYDESLQGSMRRLKKFECLGLRMPRIDLSLLNMTSINPEDLVVLPNSFYGDSVWPIGCKIAHHLVTVSRDLNEPFEKIIARMEKFSPLGLVVPDIDLSLLNQLLGIPENKTTLMKQVSPFFNDFLGGYIHPSQILFASLILRESISDTYERFRKFQGLLELQLPDPNPENWNPFHQHSKCS
ncbi:MAG: hypothetical protein AAF152_11410, partial [Cyanobacteria bacterium P01_A01_bin.114]